MYSGKIILSTNSGAKRRKKCFCKEIFKKRFTDPSHSMNLPTPEISVPPGKKLNTLPSPVKKALYSLIENLFFHKYFTGIPNASSFCMEG